MVIVHGNGTVSHTVTKITIWAIFNLLKKVIWLKPKEKFAKLQHVHKGQNCLKLKMAEFFGRAYYSKRLFFVQLSVIHMYTNHHHNVKHANTWHFLLPEGGTVVQIFLYNHLQNNCDWHLSNFQSPRGLVVAYQVWGRPNKSPRTRLLKYNMCKLTKMAWNVHWSLRLFSI